MKFCCTLVLRFIFHLKIKKTYISIIAYIQSSTAFCYFEMSVVEGIGGQREGEQIIWKWMNGRIMFQRLSVKQNVVDRVDECSSSVEVNFFNILFIIDVQRSFRREATA